jgi:hypothetical protein
MPSFHGWRPVVTLPKHSIAAKLYAIFALMATTTLALSVVAVTNARHHAALTDAGAAKTAMSFKFLRGEK